ncbi:O-acyltransferase like protein-like [Copidosoma floridanum]|uniref:O-acyltransferase like protein-like n=1 Tax=Copidosoma floridanum TaxID=29053 RepID=UPI000C6F9D5D|nr:O-acyltransferase like protein-like [Copidosoma floridanum]
MAKGGAKAQSAHDAPVHVTSAETYLEAYTRLLQNKRFEETFRSLTPEAIIGNFNERKNETVSAPCASALAHYVRGIGQREPWALKMQDASSKLPSGIMTGNIMNLGSFDECVGARGRSAGVDIRGRHCMYEFNLTRSYRALPYDPTMSICLPNSCTERDLLSLIVSTVGAAGDSVFLPTRAKCVSERGEFWDGETTLVVFICGAYCGFLLLCTVYDAMGRWLADKDCKSEDEKTLVRFSLLKNAESVLTTESQKNNLPVINGLRFISTMSIVMVHDFNRILEVFNNIYLVTHTRAAPYFLGVVLGFIIETNCKLSKVSRSLGWLVATGIVITIFFGTKFVLDANYKYILLLEMLGSSSARFCWSFVVCWIIFSSINGSAGPLQKLFSWKYFLPLSKLSYSMFLLHIIFPFMRMMTSRNPLYINDWLTTHSYIGNLVLSIVFSFFYTIAVEMPVFSMDDLLLRRKCLPSKEDDSPRLSEPMSNDYTMTELK